MPSSHITPTLGTEGLVTVLRGVTRAHTLTHTHTQVLPLPRAVPHRHAFQMWTVKEEACKVIVNFVLGRKGRLFEYPRLPRPAVLVEGYQQEVKMRGRAAMGELPPVAGTDALGSLPAPPPPPARVATKRRLAKDSAMQVLVSNCR